MKKGHIILRKEDFAAEPEHQWEELVLKPFGLPQDVMEVSLECWVERHDSFVVV